MTEQSLQPQPAQEPVDLQVDTSGPDTGAPDRGAELGGSDRAHQVITRLLRVTYPHDAFPDGPYERTAAAVEEAARSDADHNRALVQGLAGLDRAAGGDFLSLDDQAAEQLLRDRSDEFFFRRIRSTAVVALYDDQEVWGLLGYEGPSYDKGGYVDRGFDDLDWLPDPRVEEYDKEPRVELVTKEDRP
jgi:hypothetical protein